MSTVLRQAYRLMYAFQLEDQMANDSAVTHALVCARQVVAWLEVAQIRERERNLVEAKKD